MPDEQNQRRQEARRVKAAKEHELLALDNVTGVFTGTKTTNGVDTGAISIVVTVSAKKDVPAKQRVPAEIDGVPTDVIEEVIEPMQLMAAVRLEDLQPVVDTTKYSTLQGGMSIGPCRSFYREPPEVDASGNYVFVGTLGCIVRDNATEEPMMLSNFHVMCVDNTWSAGDTMAQPSLVDGGSCPGDRVGSLSRAQLASGVDAAVSSISGRPHLCEILDIGEVKGVTPATKGMAVRKRGRTTELTHGVVIATDYTTTVDYGSGVGTVTFTNQIRIANDPEKSPVFGKKGDSGSVVVDDDNNVVGLYFAGNQSGTVGVANQIADVTSALGVSVCTGIKTWEKGAVKEFIPEKPLLKFEKFEAKEIEVKGHQKEFLKDWKEWAYEKFGQFEGYEPWGRGPWERLPSGGQPPLGRPPMAGPAGVGASGAGHLAANSGWRGRRHPDGCVDFTIEPVGAIGNPVSFPPFNLYVYDYQGGPTPYPSIVNWGAFTGLHAGFAADIKLDRECPVVQVTLVHFAQPATMEAYNADGTLAGTATMTPVQQVEQTLTIQGTGISFVRITCPQDETIITGLCCCTATTCVGEHVDKPWKEFKDGVKEWKEPKELKEGVKEWKEPKELKESVKELKEPKEIAEGGAPHFIPPSLRPDLGRGALRREPDDGHGPRRLRQQGR